MDYLLANHHFGRLTGSELWTYELGQALLKRHHNVEYFGVEMTRDRNPTQSDGARVFQAGVKPDPSLPDIIVAGQYTTVAHLARLFPETPIVQVIHGFTDPLDAPAPDVENLVRYLCISPELYHRTWQSGIPPDMVELTGQLIDHQLFEEHAPTRQHADHVLIISRRIPDERRVRVECAASNIHATCLSIPRDTGELSPYDVAARIEEADIVVGMGRAIIEAMFCGRTPLIYDIHGGAGTPTMDTYGELAASNFSGRPNGQDYTISQLTAKFDMHYAYDADNLANRAYCDYGTQWSVARLDLFFMAMAWTWYHNPARIDHDKHSIGDAFIERSNRFTLHTEPS